MRSTRPVFLAGPTASGKSAVALHLAERLNGEILAVDSMQVYRGMDIGTAKPSAEEQRRIRHYLIDLAEPGETFDAAQWLEAARTALDGIVARGATPIFCGGTGFYFRTWWEGLPSLPPPDPAMRAVLERIPLSELLAELAERDPQARSRIDPCNARRVVRAVEIARLTGAARTPRAIPTMDGRGVFLLRRDPADLRRRIEARVDQMFMRGLVDETRRLMDAGLAANRTAMQALGYRQVVEHLRGGPDLSETIRQVKTRTWQFARRQMTWFRHQCPGQWIDVAPDEAAEDTAQRILDSLDAQRHHEAG